MTYKLLQELTESRMYPSRRSLEKEDFAGLTRAVYLSLLTLRILLSEQHHFAHRYIEKIVRHANFDTWSADGNDLYMAMYALTNGEYPHEGHHVPDSLNGSAIMRWLRFVGHDHDREVETKRLFVRLDSMLWITDSTLKALRRQIQEWPRLTNDEKRLAVEHLLRILRVKTPKLELLQHLKDVARDHRWETGDEDEPKTPKLPDVPKGYRDPTKRHKSDKDVGSLLGALATMHGIRENASAGATGAASVASVVKPLGADSLGAGFSGNGAKYPYGGTTPVLLRRGEAPKKPK